MDDRAIHAATRDAVRAALGALPKDRPLRVVEIGAGAGGAFAEWLDLCRGVPSVEFTLTDRDPGLLRACRGRVADVGRKHGFRVFDGEDGVRLEGPGPGGGGGSDPSVRSGVVRVGFVRAEVPGDFREWRPRCDLLVARSFWDLTSPSTAFDVARGVLRPGGVFYATLTFAGETGFEPEPADPVVERRILDRYHASMEAPGRGGDSRAGARLAAALRTGVAGFRALSTGRSDWRVSAPGAPGGYPGDEAFFVKYILSRIEAELKADGTVPTDALAAWLAARRAALRSGRLAYSALQFDIACVAEAPR